MPENTTHNHRPSAHRQHEHQQQQPLLDIIHTLPKELRNLLAGGLAGMVAKSFVAPIDRIKILYQVTSAHFRLRDVPAVAFSIIEKEGYSALWKGNLATMIRVFPYSGIQFMVFDRCKMHFLNEKEKNRQKDLEWETSLVHEEEEDEEQQRFSEVRSHKTRQLTPATKGGLTPLESLISGMIAGTISVLCTYPLDLARAQLAVLRKKKIVAGQKPATKGLGYVLTASFQQGGVAGLYRGITPTLLGILPYSGIAFTINEQAKRQIIHIFQREPTTIERLQCGALSGLFAQSVAYPLEVTRRRMQTIGIVPTYGSESASINFTGVAKGLKPSVDELPQVVVREQQLRHTQHNVQQQQIQSEIVQQTSSPRETATRTTFHKPPTMTTTMRHLLEEQGLRGFFKGVSMNWVKGPIAFSISFTTFDTIQGWIETEGERERKSQLSRITVQRRITTDED